MKIAFAIESELSLRGGVNVLLESLIDALPPEWEVALISMDPAGSAARSLHPRVAQHIPWTSNTSSTQARAVAEACKKGGIQLVHFHGGVFGFGMRLPNHCPIRQLRNQGVRSIWTNHTWVSLLTGYLGIQRSPALRLAALPVAWLSRVRELRAVARLIASSKYALRKERLYYWPARAKTELIYYTRSSVASDTPKERQKTIVSVGHVAERKGQLTLLKAFRRIAGEFPDWRLQIIGPPVEPEYMSKLESLASDPELRGRVELLGGVRDGHRFTESAGVFVQPSLFEGLPVALMEAFSCASACVATACQGNDELAIHGVNSLVVPKSDDQALSNSIASLIRDPGLRDRLGRSAQAYIISNGMTREAMVEKHLALYRRLTKPCLTTDALTS
jgi:glycosyltransferase involved in cell wall biosynthesis